MNVVFLMSQSATVCFEHKPLTLRLNGILLSFYHNIRRQTIHITTETKIGVANFAKRFINPPFLAGHQIIPIFTSTFRKIRIPSYIQIVNSYFFRLVYPNYGSKQHSNANKGMNFMVLEFSMESVGLGHRYNDKIPWDDPTNFDLGLYYNNNSLRNTRLPTHRSRTRFVITDVTTRPIISIVGSCLP